jgi:hypothetical protein
MFSYESVKLEQFFGRYASLSTDESVETKSTDSDTDLLRYEEAPIHHQNWKIHYVRNAVIALLVSLCGLLAIFLIRSHERTYEHATANLHCGTSNTTTEARALGCEFDILSYSWTPKQCFDKDTALEFSDWLHNPDRQMNGFPFFYDVAGKDHISGEDELAKSFGSMIYTTQEEHLGHCTFMMRRLYRVAESNGRIRLNSRYGTLEHTKHCSEEILLSFRRPDPRDLGGIHASLGVSFEHC